MLTRKLQYLIDSADMGSLASSYCLLHEILTGCDLSRKPVAIILNKTDSTDDITLSIVQNILRLGELKHIIPHLEIYFGSSLHTELASIILKWANYVRLTLSSLQCNGHDLSATDFEQDGGSTILT